MYWNRVPGWRLRLLGSHSHVVLLPTRTFGKVLEFLIHCGFIPRNMDLWMRLLPHVDPCFSTPTKPMPPAVSALF